MTALSFNTCQVPKQLLPIFLLGRFSIIRPQNIILAQKKKEGDDIFGTVQVLVLHWRRF